MNKRAEGAAAKAVDSIQERLADYAYNLSYDDLSAEAIHTAKLLIIDTFGVLIGGFFAETSRIARDLAAQVPDRNGATVLGTAMKTLPDMAAFVNATTARYMELTDTYHWPGSYGGHPSDVITPVFAAAEHVRASGKQLITSVALVYEVYMRISDVFDNMGFDHTNLCSLGVAAGAGKLFGLTREQMAHCISMAVVPNNALRIARVGHLSSWKVTASGQAGRAGVFAAQLARAGMEGPHLPFEGKSAWCDHVALHRFSLRAMGNKTTPFKILDTSIKLRPSVGLSISSILAAEKVAPITDLAAIEHVTVEVYEKAKATIGTSEHHWHPDTKETADHSIPYVVAATLMDGVLTVRSFNQAHLSDPKLHALLQKITVEANDEFTKAYESVPTRHRTRVTVVLRSGEKLVGESGTGEADLTAQKNDDQVVEKFRALTADVLSPARADKILERLWSVENLANVAEIPPDLEFA